MTKIETRMEWVEDALAKRKDGGRKLSIGYFMLPDRLDKAIRVYCEFKGITQREWLTAFLLEHIDARTWLEMTAIVEDCENYKTEASTDEGSL